MRYLILMDELRQSRPWIGVVVLALLSAIMIWSPRISRGWRRVVMRIAGFAFLGIATLAGAMFGLFAGFDQPRQHFVAISPDDSSVALLSHSEFRHGAATEVTVAPHGCCTRFIAYRYVGDGDDGTGPKSMQWLDDKHLKIEYVRDTSSTIQDCVSKIADIVVICAPRSEHLP